MDPIKLIGKKYFLKTLLHEDVTERYVGWLNNPEINRFLEVRFDNSTIDNTIEFIKTFDNENRFIFGIYSLSNNQHIGNIALYNNPFHNVAHFGYFIGDKNFWGKSAAIEAVKLLLNFAFSELKIRKIFGGVYLTNISSIFNYKKLGFVQEGRLRKHYIYDGKPTDGLIFSILKEEWLNE